ncbi:MAG: vWA domain-containing protein, partial [Bryobacteraceae bacterium]
QEATTAQTYQLNDAGFYELRLANGRQDVVGVNSDRRESNLAVMSPDALSLWAGKPNGVNASPSAQVVATASASEPKKFSPSSLWWYVMLLVLLTAVVESWVANLHLGVRREE